MVKVEFMPSGRRAVVPLGSLLTDAMQEAGVLLPLDCGGNGSCGRCLSTPVGQTSDPTPSEMRLLDTSQRKEGLRLSCQTQVLGDLSVMIPEFQETADSSWPVDAGDGGGINVDSPIIRSIPCDVPRPGLDDSRSDVGRVLDGVAPQHEQHTLWADHVTAGQLSQKARCFDWHVNAFLRGSEVVGVSQQGQGPLGLALDLGSTKLAAYLVNLETGNILAARGRINPQVIMGADVVTRIQRAISDPADGQRLTRLIRDAAQALAQELVYSVGTDTGHICEMSLVGNSAMTHLLLGLPLEQLGSPPFVASTDQALDIKARELGLNLAPGAYLYIPPLIGGFVGSDNVAMIMGADLDKPGPCRLGLDIGTNTEVVLTVPGNKNHLFIASAPSGPTFEGAHLSSGMRAMGGAVSKVRIMGLDISFETIDGQKPSGICGSGIIDIIAEMLREKIINKQGHLDRSLDRTQGERQSIRYVLIPGDQTSTGKDISVTQSDISQVQLAKAAINAATNTLLAKAGLAVSDISEIILAGSFGSHIDVENARCIGLIPDIPGAIYKQVGNAAGKGAQLVLNNRTQRQRALAVPGMSSYVELTRESQFNSLFARSLAFP